MAGDNTIVYMSGEGISLFNAQGRLIAQRFDPKKGRLLGLPADLTNDEIVEFQWGTGLSDIFFRMPEQFVGMINRNLSWLYPGSGAVEASNFAWGAYERFSLSSDGRRLRTVT